MQLSRRDAVEKKIRSNPGIGTKELTQYFKCDSKAITNALVGLKARGIKIISKKEGTHGTRQAFYTIAGKQVSKVVSKSIVSNPISSIRPRGFDNLTNDQIVATFSSSERNHYFNLLETANVNKVSAELLLTARRERIKKESEVPVVKF